MKPNTSKLLPEEIIDEIKKQATEAYPLTHRLSSPVNSVARALVNQNKRDKSSISSNIESWKRKVQRAFNQKTKGHGATKKTRDVIGRFMGFSDWDEYILVRWQQYKDLLDKSGKKDFYKKNTPSNDFGLTEDEIRKFDLEPFELFYLYYYLGSDGIVKPAILCFKRNETEKEWSEGRIYYLTNRGTKGKKINYYKHSCTFNLERILPAKPETGGTPQFLYYKGICVDSSVPQGEIAIKDKEYIGKVGKYGNQVNFYTFHCGRNVIDERYLFFANTSVINRKETKTVDTPSIQLTVIRRIEKSLIFPKIQEQVHPWIKNVLIGKRYDFNEHLECMVFKNEASFNREINILSLKSIDRPAIVNEEYYCSSQINAVYIGFYLRKSFGKNGGMAFLLLEAFEEGEVECTAFDFTLDKFVSHNGIFNFPISRNTTAIVGEFLKDSGKTRMSMFLRNIDNTKYLGVISGFSNSHIPYTSPIVFYKITDRKETYKRVKKTYFPRRVPKEKINSLFRDIKSISRAIEIKNLSRQVRIDLQKAEKEFFGMLRNCL